MNRLRTRRFGILREGWQAAPGKKFLMNGGKTLKLTSGSLIVAAVLILALPSLAQDKSAEDLAKAAQNPIAAMISVPFQFNATFNYGIDSLQKRDTQYLLNIQPVIPITLTANWNMISRTIVPVISQPLPIGDASPIGGIANIQESLFFSPSKPSKVIWGVGPVLQIPTATNHILGSSKWSGGPGFVILTMPGKWVIGALAQNVWSFAGPQDAPKVNQFLLQYFINYNLPKGWYISSSPIITSDWTQPDNKDKWTVPFGIGAGKIMRWGKQPVNLMLQYYYNAIRSTGTMPSGPYTIRFQVQFLFPKK